jgi:DNA polymerase elongation subunit (family B)
MIRKLLAATAVVVSLTVVACGGSGIDNKEAEQIRDHATEVQKDAQKTVEEVRNGTKDAEEAAKEIQEDTNDLANETIDAAKDANLPDEAKQQLEAAQKQLNEAAQSGN